MPRRDHDWRPRQERDRIPWKTVTLVLGIFLAFTAGGLLWVALSGPRPQAVPAVPTGAVPARHDVFGERSAARQLGDAQRRTLETYGWVDRDSGLVRIPIDRAMRIIATSREPDDAGGR